MRLLQATIFALLSGAVISDISLHNPRGSNNRLNENTADRKNNNRLFDSQNNNKGGYNTGDRLSGKAGNVPERVYSMQYFGSGGSSRESSKLMVEWTNQHGCGDGEGKVICNLVLQYMCQSNGTSSDYPKGNGKGKADVEERTLYMRDGTSTDALKYGEGKKGETDKGFKWRMLKNYETNSNSEKGLHETVWWYDTCKYREANGGLFTADQNLGKDKIGHVTSARTRQNNNGGRSGYECPEERDYFPYWAPTLQSDKLDRFQRTPWIDLAWLGDTSKCSFIKSNSFNRNSKWRCVLSTASDKRQYGKSITAKGCKAEKGKWVEFVSFLEVLKGATSEGACRAAQGKDSRNRIYWGTLRSDDSKKVCIVQAPEVMCKAAPLTRVNHLGNTGGGDDPNASRIEVDLPHFPSGEAKRCVMRMRYNISTGDYDPWRTDASSNNNKDVISNNPAIDVLGNGEKLQLALNTAQTGRTFQDRSHVFIVLPRLKSMSGKTIHNLNVKGKRGNLEQTFPANEYDFIPDRLTVRTSDLVHVQWTGSNSHNNNNDGNSGQGKAGTDRHNLLQMKALDKSYPVVIKNARFWSTVSSLTSPDASGEDIAIGLATSGFYCGKKATKTCPAAFTLAKKRKLNDELDNAPASYFGHVLKFSKSGTLYYMCSRNNAFTNRSQKGALFVKN